MLITPTTKSITEYTLTLSAEDAAQAMADPYSFGDSLAAQLRAAGVKSANGNGHAKAHHKPGRDHPLGYKAQAILSSAYDGECPGCGRVTWHYLVSCIGGRKLYRCAGCGCETVGRKL